MDRVQRYVGIATAVIIAVLGVGFFTQASWATALWPWPDGRLSYIFVSSIMAAIAFPLLWIALSGEWGAAIGGAANLIISAAGFVIFLVQLATTQPEGGTLWVYVLLYGVFFVTNLGILLWSRRFPLKDTRPLPRLGRLSFVVFVVVLVPVAGALLLKVPNVFPWPLNEGTSVLIGWIFTGASLYFLMPILNPRWHSAKGQLIGFLAYDLVLIVPFLQHFETVRPENRLSLVLYMIVIIYSGGLAVYYLFIHPQTRFRASAAG